MGTFGRLGIIGFNGNKTVTTGGGGAVVTNDAALARRARHLSTTAKRPQLYRFDHDEVAFNYRMPNLNAALGVAQLERLDAAVNEKRRLAAAYQRAFRDVDGVVVFVEPEGARSNYWLNALMLDDVDESARDALLERTNAAGIMTRPAWTLLHRLPMYAQALCPTPPCESREQVLGEVATVLAGYAGDWGAFMRTIMADGRSVPAATAAASASASRHVSAIKSDRVRTQLPRPVPPLLGPQ